MKYTMVRVFLVAISCCTLLASANTASAGWRHRHGGGGGSSGGMYGGYGSSGGGYVASYGSSGGGYGSSGGYVASYGSSGGYVASYGSSGGGGSTGHWGGGSSGGGTQRVGILRRLFHHHRNRPAYAGYGSSGGQYAASYGSSGGSSGGYYSTGYGSSGGAVSYGSGGGGFGSSGGGVVVPYESGYLGVSNQAPSSAASLASYQSVSSDSVHLNVEVPPAAKVFVNDMPTSSVGASRQFVSRGLQEGKKYKFVVRAEVVDASGQVASEEKVVTLTAGQRDELSFASLAQTPVQTAVTLNVPADAQVVLAGNPTAASGETRTFRTSQLKAGERWDDYVVEVHYAGKVKRETLRLVAGDDVALTFNFDDDKSLVASR